MGANGREVTRLKQTKAAAAVAYERGDSKQAAVNKREAHHVCNRVC